MIRSRSFLSSKKVFKIYLFKSTKGFKGSRKNLYKISSKALIKSLVYSKRDRRKRTHYYKLKYIYNITKYLILLNLTYSKFKFLLHKSFIILNLKSWFDIINYDGNGSLFLVIIKNLFN